MTEPKTPKSRRVLPIPPKLADMLRVYLNALYKPDPADRLFPFTKHYFRQQMQVALLAEGVDRNSSLNVRR